MPESVTITLPVTEDIQPGAYAIFFSDDADGVMKFDQPISPRVPLRSPTDRSVYHLQSNHLSGRHLSGVGRAGHLAGLHLEHEHLGHQDTATFSGGSFYGPTGTTGRTQLAVKIYDKEGRSVATIPNAYTQTFNTSPNPPRDLAVASTQSLPAPQITLSFVPSSSLKDKSGVGR